MDKLDNILFNHKIYPGNKGFTYIKDIILETPLDLSLVKITDIYKSTADKFNTKEGNVARCLRYSFASSDLKDSPPHKQLALLQLEYKYMED